MWAVVLKCRSSKDVLTGILFASIGLIGLLTAYRYPLGTAFEMGPGYLPIAVSGMLILVGLALIGSSLKSAGESLTGMAWRPLALVTGAVILFALLLEPLGLALSSMILVLVARLGGPEFHLREAGILAFVLAAVVVLVFVYGLKMSIPVFPV